MLFRKLVLLGGACTLLLAYHGGYWLSDWPWLFLLCVGLMVVFI